MTTNIKNLPVHKKEKAVSALFALAKNIKDKDAALVFIQHLLTESEQVTIGRRILIAKMLLSGSNRSEVRYELGVSPNTFARARKWLENELPNYGDALKDYEKRSATSKAKRQKLPSRYVDSLSFEALRYKYPMHFLLFNLLLK